MSERELTGRKVLLMFVAFFGVIISVNLVLAYQAIKTFPGLETKNAYVASQNFDADKAAQLALGWDVSVDASNGELRVAIRDGAGVAVQLEELDATLGQATNIAQDTTPDLQFDGSDYVAPINLAPGNWNLRMVARAQNGALFRRRIVIHVLDQNG